LIEAGAGKGELMEIEGVSADAKAKVLQASGAV
jgi:hypothetical protein